MCRKTSEITIKPENHCSLPVTGSVQLLEVAPYNQVFQRLAFSNCDKRNIRSIKNITHKEKLKDIILVLKISIIQYKLPMLHKLKRDTFESQQ